MIQLANNANIQLSFNPDAEMLDTAFNVDSDRARDILLYLDKALTSYEGLEIGLLEKALELTYKKFGELTIYELIWLTWIVATESRKAI